MFFRVIDPESGAELLAEVGIGIRRFGSYTMVHVPRVNDAALLMQEVQQGDGITPTTEPKHDAGAFSEVLATGLSDGEHGGMRQRLYFFLRLL